jgi:1-acyl-sn-glycerol-3-phosphate acyltransferase
VIYLLVRAVASLALRLFYRVQVRGAAALPDGPLLLVGNHPNGLIDPALVFVITPRRVTFLAKAPLFRIPVLGWLIRGMGALPVYRKQDDPTRMGGNDATLDTAADALVTGGAITLFPEGKSHSEPQLAALKTGAARIALKALARGADVTVVPVGLTYARKNRFRSEVCIEVGAPIPVRGVVGTPGGVGTPMVEGAAPDLEPEAVRRLTDAVASGLRQVTLNLESWEDLPLVQTAEALWALRRDGAPGDVERLRRFARGVSLFRTERPEDFERLKAELLDFRERLRLMRVGTTDLGDGFRPATVARFVARMLVSLIVGLPFALLGTAVFSWPFLGLRSAVHALRPERDIVATYKLLGGILFFPLWCLLLAGLAASAWGPWWGAGVLVALPPLALWTRHAVEAWSTRVRDIRLFFQLGSRSALRRSLLAEGETLAAHVEREAQTYLAASGG